MNIDTLTGCILKKKKSLRYNSQLVPFSTEEIYSKRLAISYAILRVKEKLTTKNDGHELSKQKRKVWES